MSRLSGTRKRLHRDLLRLEETPGLRWTRELTACGGDKQVLAG
jgi:hypothetical protein